MIRAIAWDIDGTLIDSEPSHQAALVKVSGRYGAPVDEVDPRFTGMAMEQVFEILSPLYPASLSVGAWIEDIVADYVAHPDRLRHLPGAREAVAALAHAGVPQVCVSNSVRRIVEANLAWLNLGEAIGFAIAREDVTNGKPDPEPYALACKRLALSPEHVLAVEDSDVGAASARAAGLQVLRVDAKGEAFADLSRLSVYGQEIGA